MSGTDIRVLLAHNMKQYRIICNLSQMSLAEKVGCSTTLIANIETMNRFPSADMFNRIAAALHVSPAELVADQTPALERLRSAYEVREQLEKSIKTAIDSTLGLST